MATAKTILQQHAEKKEKNPKQIELIRGFRVSRAVHL